MVTDFDGKFDSVITPFKFYIIYKVAAVGIQKVYTEKEIIRN